MWRIRHLIVLLSLFAVGYYFTFMLHADWKVILVLVALLSLTYVGASLADPGEPEDSKEPEASDAAEKPEPRAKA